MRRADRLFMIVEQLRPARLMTARELAERLEVSERTIYRDIADLIGAGVPIEGAAGAGYLMRAGYDLPPVMLTRDEAAALMLGARMMRAFGGQGQARAAGEAMDKIAAVLPAPLAQEIANLPLFAIAPLTNELTPDERRKIDRIEAAIGGNLSLRITYRRLSDDSGSNRLVLPASLLFWGNVWTLAAFCTLRQDLRMFRLDRITALSEDAPFPTAQGRSLRAEVGRRTQAHRSTKEGAGPLP